MDQLHLLMVATSHNLHLKLQQGITSLLQRTICKEVGLPLSPIMLAIIHSSPIHLGTEMVVHISGGMVLTIITMGTGVNKTVGIRTGIIIEILMVETLVFLQEMFQDL